MISSRDVYTQAVFCLKGKPLNCYGQGKEAIYKNLELYNVMKALGIEDSLEDLRYNKVVIATDADVDGLHIRNLLLTFFLQFYEPLVLQGNIYMKHLSFVFVTRKQHNIVTARLKRMKHLKNCRKGLISR